MKLRVVLSIVFALSIVTSMWSAENTYIGVKKCKMCHNKAKTGKQYTVWSKAAHAKAYEILASDEAKAIAKKKEIVDPQKAAECLSCHVTAYGKSDAVRGKLTLEEGVSCEACHGPGSAYKSMKIMKAIHAGKEKADAHGLITPTKEVCVTCHNSKSPTFKEFNYDEAVKKIAHPINAVQ